MKPSEALARNRDAIRRLVIANGATNPRVFGSVLHGEDTEDSDLDLLVDPIRGQTTLLSLARMKRALEETLGVRVDLATPNALREEMRQSVLEEARSL